MVYAQTRIIWENETHNILRDFGMQTDYQIPARRERDRDRERSSGTVDFAVPADHRIKIKENDEKDKYIDLAGELKKLWNMKVTVIPIVIDVFGTISKGWNERFGNWRTSQDYLKNSIIEIGHNIEKNPGDLSRVAVTHTQMKDH